MNDSVSESPTQKPSAPAKAEGMHGDLRDRAVILLLKQQRRTDLVRIMSQSALRGLTLLGFACVAWLVTDHPVAAACLSFALGLSSLSWLYGARDATREVAEINRSIVGLLGREKFTDDLIEHRRERPTFSLEFYILGTGAIALCGLIICFAVWTGKLNSQHKTTRDPSTTRPAAQGETGASSKSGYYRIVAPGWEARDSSTALAHLDSPTDEHHLNLILGLCRD